MIAAEKAQLNSDYILFSFKKGFEVHKNRFFQVKKWEIQVIRINKINHLLSPCERILKFRHKLLRFGTKQNSVWYQIIRFNKIQNAIFLCVHIKYVHGLTTKGLHLEIKFIKATMWICLEIVFVFGYGWVDGNRWKAPDKSPPVKS